MASRKPVDTIHEAQRVAAQRLEAMRLACRMGQLGFDVVHTGGGCWAFSRPDGGGFYTWVTGEGGSVLPRAFDESALVGVYDPEGEQVSIDAFVSMTDFIQAQSHDDAD